MFHFVKSAEKPDQYPSDKLNEVCFIGRSNVGKSSLINALCNSNIAKTSSTPGRTQLVNFFSNDVFKIVDLPGYGFAKLDKKQIESINNIIFNYLENSKNLKLVIQICDANVIMEQDLEMSNYIKSLNKDYLLVLNKVDKEKMYRYKNKINQYLELFKITEKQLIFVSAKTGFNIKELYNLISGKVKGRSNG